MIINDIIELIGNTPLLKIKESIHNIPNLTIYAKLEILNPFGSLKDRIAWEMLRENIQEIKKKKMCVIESSSGNTSRALTSICAKDNIKFINYTNRIKENNIRDILQILGCNIVEIPGVLECRPSNPYDRNDPKKIALDIEKSNPEKYLYTKQYENPKNPGAQEKLGKEIVDDLSKVDFFFSFLGTGGSSLGAGKILQSIKQTKVIGVVSDEEEYIPGGRSLTEMWETGFFNPNFYDEILTCNVKSAIDGMLTLNREVGLHVGPTAGATYQMILDYFTISPPKNPINVVFIACDRLELYTDYIKQNRPSLFTNIEIKESISELTNEDVNIFSYATQSTKGFEIIIDIRSSLIFKSHSIPKSINIPYQLLKPIIEEDNAFSNIKKIVFVCTNGNISSKVSAYVNKKYKIKTLYLQGGIKAYKQQHTVVQASCAHTHR